MKYEIRVWQVDHVYPWRFSVIIDSETWFFVGVPNYCSTKHQAICRAHVKAKRLIK